jgi:hypothetical protein
MQNNERPNWTDSGGVRKTKDMITLPSKNWAWVSDWQIDREFLE